MDTINNYPKITTLIESIINTLEENNKSIGDICWVGMSDGIKAGTWADFILKAEGLAPNNCSPDLIIVGFDWWLEVDKYWGGWRYCSLPSFEGTEKLDKLDICLWNDL